jgi:transglutaminase-like putative cysteine protease
MWLRTTCNLHFTLDQPTPFIFMLRPRSGAHQWIARETYLMTPMVPVHEYTDTYGNLCQRLVAPAGTFSITTTADVDAADAAQIAPGAPYVDMQHLPDAMLTYLLPTRYCESDQFVDMAHDIVGDAAPGYDQVARIVDWIRAEVRFNPASPYFQQSAVEVNHAREGVCRDLAHVGIAMCRALCIPARMVVGYLVDLDPMDFHAWFEAYVGGQWYGFDATQKDERGGRVAVAYGHDAADVAIFTQFGPAPNAVAMSVSVERINAPQA